MYNQLKSIGTIHEPYDAYRTLQLCAMHDIKLLYLYDLRLRSQVAVLSYLLPSQSFFFSFSLLFLLSLYYMSKSTFNWNNCNYRKEIGCERIYWSMEMMIWLSAAILVAIRFVWVYVCWASGWQLFFSFSVVPMEFLWLLYNSIGTFDAVDINLNAVFQTRKTLYLLWKWKVKSKKIKRKTPNNEIIVGSPVLGRFINAN